jgi:3-methyladenine DNA glycosylase/8-oxoguanine DNA glycosylase
MNLLLSVPANFNFWRTVYSHGWCSLPPFEVVKERSALQCVSSVSGGTIVDVEMQQVDPSVLRVQIGGVNSLCRNGRREIRDQVKSCLRLDEDFSGFYTEARKHSRFRWIPKTGAGRLLRSPTVFEDVMKMMCTTNCSWALTEIMVNNLCTKFGTRIDESRWSFPLPEVIADSSEKFLRKQIRAGYRSPYLLEFARRVACKQIDPESWRTSSLPTEELFREARSVKGIGPYAAGNLLKLLGRYDYLGIDSWCRGKFFEIHTNGRKVTDKTIERHYEPFGKWRGLFFWLDVTKHWYDHKFPF